jgi:hypothetical protein
MRFKACRCDLNAAVECMNFEAVDTGRSSGYKFALVSGHRWLWQRGQGGDGLVLVWRLSVARSRNFRVRLLIRERQASDKGYGDSA